MLALSGAAQASCPAAAAFEAGAQASRWDELDAQGVRLVRERGTLAAAVVGFDARCRDAQWSLRLEQAQGLRAYDGRSTTGTPIRSTSHLRLERLHLQARRPWREGVGWIARASIEQLQRDIDSVGRVAGYPERFRSTQAAVGLSFDGTPAPGLQLAASGWIGAGPPGQVRLQLPGTDAMTLRLGASRLAGVGLRLASTAGASPSPAGWEGGVECLRQHIGAGPPGAITRQGVPVGGASQPETRTQACTVALRWRVAFD